MNESLPPLTPKENRAIWVESIRNALLACFVAIIVIPCLLADMHNFALAHGLTP